MTSAMTADEKRDWARDHLQDFLEQAPVQAWAHTRRYLHAFSITNQLLLTLQLADPSREGMRMDGIQAAWRWKKAGYHPAKGSMALYIWAPHRLKKGDDGGWTCKCGAPRAFAARCAQGHERPSRFVLKPVFSAGQVVSFEDQQPPPPPPRPQPLTGDTHGHLLPRLAEWATSTDGPRVREVLWANTSDDSHLAGGAGGYFRPSDRRIVVAADWPPNAQVRVLVHELVHAMGASYEDYGREQAEVIADGAAMLACASLGLDTTPASMAYVAGWGGAEGQDPAQVLRGHLAVIDGLARRIEQACTDPEPTE